MSNEPKFKISKLRKAVKWAQREAAGQKEVNKAGAWDQEHWATGTVASMKTVATSRYGNDLVAVDCGTSFCIAGAVCANEKDLFLVDKRDASRKGEVVSVDTVLPKGDLKAEPMYVRQRAQDLLGIDHYEADRLFEASNTIEDVIQIAKRICADRGKTL